MQLRLHTPLSGILRTTNDHLAALERMGIKTVEDLLNYLPRKHEDLTEIRTLAQCELGEKATLRGTIDGLKSTRLRGGKVLVSGMFTDADGMQAKAVWFNQPHILRMLQDGMEIVLTGRLIEKQYALQIQSPQFERAGERPLLHAGRLVPVYPQHESISTRWLREKMPLVSEAIELLHDPLPQSLVAEEKLLSRSEAVRALHFPQSPDQVEKAWERIAFEESYRVQTQALERKRLWQGERQQRLRIPMDTECIRSFFESLHFTPTDGQRIAIYEILRDLEKDVPMSRLLEGDVGSGKTLVAVAVMAAVVRAGGQCALMVPTEVLAKQHAESVLRLFLTYHEHLTASGTASRLPTVRLLTGSTPAADARHIREGLEGGSVDIVIGTHALIEDAVQFHDLRLVIVDEQHRFGVMQRARLKDKGTPHFLAMTATPIPRTLALTAYGDHDLSVLQEKPGNRRPIKTKVVAPQDRPVVERFIDAQIEDGRQVFVICPLIEVSDAEEIQDVKSVTVESARLQEVFPHRRIAVLHGRLPPPEKERILREFRDRSSDLLVSTSVIEVGIDVPNATIMVIEGAERFGLAQLHQFRGRVGRAEHASYCFLFTTDAAQARSRRLKAMEQHDSGFQLAEIDLDIRGPGEVFGTRQSGMPDIRFPHLLRPEVVVRARRAAERVLGVDATRAA